jgi:hypothetical protein
LGPWKETKSFSNINSNSRSFRNYYFACCFNDTACVSHAVLLTPHALNKIFVKWKSNGKRGCLGKNKKMHPARGVIDTAWTKDERFVRTWQPFIGHLLKTYTNANGPIQVQKLIYLRGLSENKNFACGHWHRLHENCIEYRTYHSEFEAELKKLWPVNQPLKRTFDGKPQGPNWMRVNLEYVNFYVKVLKTGENNFWGYFGLEERSWPFGKVPNKSETKFFLNLVMLYIKIKHAEASL